MRFFTPELYLHFNSSDDEIADGADDAWERATIEYKRYLKEHRSKMPANVRALAEKCCFHDATLLGWQAHERNGSRHLPGRRMLTIGLQHGDEMVVLYYFLTNPIKEIRRRKGWPFSPDRKHWLYDEIAVASSMMHSILWSDGSELEIPFEDIIVDRFPALAQATA